MFSKVWTIYRLTTRRKKEIKVGLNICHDVFIAFIENFHDQGQIEIISNYF